MPVAAPVRCLARHNHQVPQTRRDLLLAARATVGFPGLERMYQPNLETGVRVLVTAIRQAGFARHGPDSS
jgi:hypothetical protein